MLVILLLLMTAHCCDPNCALCVNSTRCISCLASYFVDPTSNQCISNSICSGNNQLNCRQCNYQQCLPNGDAGQCWPGYYLQYSQYGVSCQSCKSTFCSICDSNQCTQCMNQYFLNPSSICESCIEGCTTCNNSISCMVCQPGYKVSANNQCEVQDRYPGYYLNLNFDFVPCNIQCYLCSFSLNNCTQCTKGYYFNATNQCAKCASACLTCISASLCTSCLQGVLRNYQCVFSCLDVEYFDPLASLCVSCADQCLSCSNLSQNCTSCRDPIQYSYNNGTCTLRCASGYFMQPKNLANYLKNIYTDGYTVCAACSNSCIACKNQSFCIHCSNNTLLVNHQCLNGSDCGVGFYLVQYNGSSYCLACDSVCMKCLNSTVCLSCVSKYTLSNGICTLNYSNCTGYTLNQFCFTTCPANTVANSTSKVCQCDPSCKICSYSNLNPICLTCYNSSQYQFQGACYNVCPTLSITNYNIGNYTLNKCVNSCPDGYKLSGNSCVTQCQSNQYELQKICINAPLNEYIDYNILFASNGISQLKCSSNCLRCGSSQICLECAGGYFIEKFHNNSYLCTPLCNLTEISKVNSAYCQSCRINCVACDDFLYFDRYSNTCALVCRINYQYSNITNSCEPQQSLILTVIGNSILYQGNYFYSYTQELRIRIANTSVCGELEQFTLTTNFSNVVVTAFSMVITPRYTDILLNSSVLQRGTTYIFFVKCGTILNSTTFYTVPLPSGAIKLSSNFYTPIVGYVSLNISNFTCINIPSFNLSIYIRSSQDQQTLIYNTTMQANINFSTNISLPLTKSSSVVINVWITSLYSTYNYTSSLTRTSNSTALFGTNFVDVLTYLNTQLKFVTFNNISVITQSIQLAIGKFSTSFSTCSCNHGYCVNNKCQCYSGYVGANCDYTPALSNGITTMQSQILGLIVGLKKRVLISQILMPASTLIDCLYTISLYPDRINESQLKTSLMYMDTISTLKSLVDALKFVNTFNNLISTSDLLDVSEYLTLFQQNLQFGAQSIITFVNTTYKVNFSNTNLYIVNSEDFLPSLMTVDYPTLSINLSSYTAITFKYSLLLSNPYQNKIFLYVVTTVIGNQTYVYFSTGTDQTIFYNFTIGATNYIFFTQKWNTLNTVSVNAIQQNQNIGVIIYHTVLVAQLLIVVMISQYKSRKESQQVLKKVVAVRIQSGLSERNNKEIDEMTNARHQNSFNLDNIPIEKEIELNQNQTEKNQQLAQNNESQLKMQEQEYQERQQQEQTVQSNRYIYILMNKSLIFPTYLWYILINLEYISYYGAVCLLNSESFTIKFLVSLCILGSLINMIPLLTIYSLRRLKKYRIPHITGILFLVVFVLAISIMQINMNKQDTIIAIALSWAIALIHWLIVDTFLYLYSSTRNQNKHRTAGVIRWFMRWKRMIDLSKPN